MKRHIALPAALALATLASALPVSAYGPKDDVVIEGTVSFTSYPFVGTFIVTDGAAALGCLGGTTTETFRSPVAVSSITRVMTCTSGGTGTITLNFYPLAGIPGPGDDNGRWTIIGATGDFQGLHGEGAFTGFYSDDFSSAFNIQAGKIHRSP